MDVIQDSISHAQQSYQYYLDRSDARVSEWFLMQGYTPTLLLTSLYLVAVWLGPKFMKNREAYSFQFILVAYNLFLVVVNCHIFYELLRGSILLGYSLKCQPVHYGDDPNELRIAKALWWFYFSKCLEFMDTIFFILRKKNNQVSFLHVYHHATMFPIWWIGVKWTAGGQSFFGALMNSGIHVIMYTYYGISAMGPQYQKFLWWKKYLTRIQLAQFVTGICHAVTTVIVTCDYPKWMAWALIFYAITILLLFLNFYYQTYVKASKKKKEDARTYKNGVVNGHPAKYEGIYRNGTNGITERKKHK